VKASLANSGGLKGRLRESGGARFWVFIALALFFLFLMSIGPGMFEPVFVLAFGWVQFLQRTISAVSWNWDLIGMSILASSGILLLVQKLFGGGFNNIAAARNLPWRWSWKWTWTGFVGLLMLFLVGMAVGGIAHQVGWMVSTDEPMIEAKNRKWRDYANMKQLDLEVRTALDDAGGSIEKARRELRNDQNSYVYESSVAMPMMQAFHVLVVKADDGAVIGRFIFPRNGQQREKVGGYFEFDHGESGLCPWLKLQEIIKTNRANLVAL
jgi:hypothetical protein